MAESFHDTKQELYDLMQRMRRMSFAPPSPEGLTPAEARTVMAVGGMRCSDRDTRPGRIAQMTHTTPSALSQTFKALEEKGLIERHRASGDCRAVSVTLTAEGEKLAAQGRRLHDEHLNQVMAYIGEEDVAHLVRILRKTVEFHERAAGIAAADSDCTGAEEDVKGSDAPCA